MPENVLSPQSQAIPFPLPGRCVPEVAKVLKDHLMAVQEIVFHHHQSIFCTLRLPFEGYIPFSYFLYLLFLDHVERVGLFILITASRNSFITYSSLQPATRPPFHSQS